MTTFILMIERINTMTKKHNLVAHSYSTSQLLGLIFGILSFITIYFFLNIEGLSKEGVGVLATLALMAIWWISEAVNTGITGLLPLILFPLTQSMSASATAAAYGSTTIFMFFGGFAISLALERWNLHNRIALNIINVVGTSMKRLIIGLLLASGFISMWVSNTATILMLLPIATAIAKKIGVLMEAEETYDPNDALKFMKQAIFAVGFGATIGGSTTIIGTPTNMILSGFTLELLGFEMSFGSFFFFMVPFSIIQYIAIFFILTKISYRIKVKKLEHAHEIIKEEIKNLGSVSYEEKATFIIFIITVFFWLTRTFLFSDVPGLSDMVISIVACVLFYVVPNKQGSRLLDADSVKDMPWAMILMLMGGMAVAAGFTNTDLATYLGSLLLFFENSSLLVLISIVAIFGLLMTQVAPNTATATILIPITASIATAININPLYLMIVAALSTGFATTLPSGTPVMGIMYGSGKFKISELVKVGGMLAVISVILVIAFTYTLAPLMFGI